LVNQFYKSVNKPYEIKKEEDETTLFLSQRMVLFTGEKIGDPFVRGFTTVGDLPSQIYLPLVGLDKKDFQS
jgi:hypothetical protein